MIVNRKTTNITEIQRSKYCGKRYMIMQKKWAEEKIAGIEKKIKL